MPMSASSGRRLTAFEGSGAKTTKSCSSRSAALEGAPESGAGAPPGYQEELAPPPPKLPPPPPQLEPELELDEPNDEDLEEEEEDELRNVNVYRCEREFPKDLPAAVPATR